MAQRSVAGDRCNRTAASFRLSHSPSCAIFQRSRARAGSPRDFVPGSMSCRSPRGLARPPRERPAILSWPAPWSGTKVMPFTLEDLQPIKIRFGTSEKALAELSDNQFTAWLRNIGAQGQMTVVQVAPGRFMTPPEDRVRILNELDASGFAIPV